jgi:hypothetical protein
MAFPTPKFLFRSAGVRAFFTKQVLLFVVAVALFAILWVTGVRSPGMGFVPILLYGLFIGNFTTLIMNRAHTGGVSTSPPLILSATVDDRQAHSPRHFDRGEHPLLV